MLRVGVVLIALSLAMPAGETAICGYEIKLKNLVFERASKWFGPDRKQKKALGSFIAECEADGIRYIVSSPAGKSDSPHIAGYIYRPKP